MNLRKCLLTRFVHSPNIWRNAIHHQNVHTTYRNRTLRPKRSFYCRFFSSALSRPQGRSLLVPSTRFKKSVTFVNYSKFWVCSIIVMSSGFVHEPVSVTLNILVSHIMDFGRMYWKESAALCMLLLPFATYTSLIIGNWLRINSKKDGKLPPVIPYWFPLVGSLFAIGMNPFKFLSENKSISPLPLQPSVYPLHSCSSTKIQEIVLI